MSVPATVIEPDDAGRCASALATGIRALERLGRDTGDLLQIQATFLVAYQSCQTLQIAPVSAPALHGVRAGHDGGDDLLDLSEAARQAGISRPTLYARIDRGELCPVMVGGRRFIRCSDLDRGRSR